MKWFGLLGGALFLLLFQVLVWDAPWETGLNKPWVWLTLGLAPVVTLCLSYFGLIRLAPAFRWILAATSIAVGASIIGLPTVVVWRAKQLADNTPYCIQVASQTDGYDYIPATSLFDLSAAKMQARIRRGNTISVLFQHHAILFIAGHQAKYYNWSYRHLDFVAETVDRHIGRFPKIRCPATVGYAQSLPIFHADQAFQIQFEGSLFTIPKGFAPTVEPSVNPVLAIRARAPEFVVRSDHDETDVVRLGKRLPDILEQFVSNRRDGQTVEILSDEITKQITYRNVMYIRHNDAGHIATAISCYGVFCRHKFATGEWAILFDYKINHLAHWQEMERRVSALLSSFRSAGGKP